MPGVEGAAGIIDAGGEVGDVVGVGKKRAGGGGVKGSVDGIKGVPGDGGAVNAFGSAQVDAGGGVLDGVAGCHEADGVGV